MKRLVLIEDHTAIREMLAQILSLDDRYQVVGETGDGQAGLELCLSLKPDVLVVDAKLPGMSGVEVVRQLRRQLPEVRILAFSGQQHPLMVREMIEAGAHGFVEKTAGLLELRRGVETVAEGGMYFGPAIAALLSTGGEGDDSGGRPESLTARERQILQLVAESNTTRAIAVQLGISVKTVDNHRTNLMRKLNLHDVASLTRYALDRGFVGGNP